MTNDDDLFELAAQVRKNFEAGYTEYGRGISAWRTADGVYHMAYGRNEYKTKSLFRAVRSICRMIRGR